MSWLLDTNVLLRIADGQSSEHKIAAAAVEQLLARNSSVFIAVQVLVEFWAVATRPEAVNGLGWRSEIAAEAVQALREQFPILDDSPDILGCWLELVRRCQVTGKGAHDAHLAALLLVHDVRQLLTFNTADFPHHWGVEAVHPEEVVARRNNK